MNVITMINDKQYVLPLMEAKRVLNNVYDGCKSLTINGETINIDRAERMRIMQQLHGEIYV